MIKETLRHIFAPLPLLLCLSLTFAFAACEEVEETSIYDNWQTRTVSPTCASFLSSCALIFLVLLTYFL